MTVSAAKLEANRRNAMRSCGPKTQSGKDRLSSMPSSTACGRRRWCCWTKTRKRSRERRNAWRACLLPGDEVEQRLVEDAVVCTWQQDRARRAEIARLNSNRLNYGVSQAQSNEEQVAELGRRLFTDRMGPLTFHPTGCNYDEMSDLRESTTSFAACERDELDRPADLGLAPAIVTPWLRMAAWPSGRDSRRSSSEGSRGSRPTSSRPSGCWEKSPLTPSTSGTWHLCSWPRLCSRETRAGGTGKS